MGAPTRSRQLLVPRSMAAKVAGIWSEEERGWAVAGRGKASDMLIRPSHGRRGSGNTGGFSMIRPAGHEGKRFRTALRKVLPNVLHPSRDDAISPPQPDGWWGIV